MTFSKNSLVRKSFGGSAAAALATICALFGAAGARAADPAAEPRTYTFQVVLLVAETSGPATTEGVPPKAQKALADLREFLPYKSYRLLDLAWLRTMRAASATMTGLDGITYRVRLVKQLAAPQTGERVVIENFELVEVPFAPPHATTIRTPGVEVTPTPPAAAAVLLQSSFGMELGETVVVGTSKLDGPQKALVVLLTAIP